MISIDVDEIKERLDVSAESIRVEEDSVQKNITRGSVEKLATEGIIDSQRGLKITVDVLYVPEGGGGEQEVGSVDYMVFDRNIGYIHWMSVTDRFRGRGLATVIRGAVIEDLFDNRGVDVIYSYPVSEKARRLAEKQGFVKVDLNTILDTWYRLER